MGESDTAHAFIENYKKDRFKFEQLKDLLCAELRYVALAEKIPLTHIEGRTKEPDSAFEKIKRKNYTHPEKQLIDLCGVRVITTFDADVLKMETAIRSNLHSVTDFLEDHCEKKRPPLADQFGYESMHLVVRVKNGEIPWKRYENFQVEIQIRSTLRHGWAVVSHEMVYKQVASPEREIVERMAAAAGAIYTTDRTFDDVRSLVTKKLKTYNHKITAGNLSSVPVNDLALGVYCKLRRDQIEPRLNLLKAIGIECGMQRLDLPEFDRISIGRLGFTLEARGVKTIQETEALFNQIMNDKPWAHTAMQLFMKYVRKHHGVFGADGIDILTILISMYDKKLLYDQKLFSLRLFGPDFDWSGQYLSKPTPAVLKATREACKKTMKSIRSPRRKKHA